MYILVWQTISNVDGKVTLLLAFAQELDITFLKGTVIDWMKKKGPDNSSSSSSSDNNNNDDDNDDDDDDDNNNNNNKVHLTLTSSWFCFFIIKWTIVKSIWWLHKE